MSASLLGQDDDKHVAELMVGVQFGRTVEASGGISINDCVTIGTDKDAATTSQTIAAVRSDLLNPLGASTL